LAVPRSKRLLILGGTSEARALAEALADHADLDVTTSLAGRTVAPRMPLGAIRVGGFGGAAGMADYIASAGIDIVVDATHPYATAISAHAIEACRTAARPLLRLDRPAWQAQRGDHWIVADSLAAVARLLPEVGRRAFLTIGVKELDAFSQAKDTWFLLRLVDRPSGPIPLPDFELVLARGPFEQRDERDLLIRHGIDVVVAKNSGGEATYGKIAAARDLGLPVLLLRRSPLPPAQTAASLAAALAWIEARLV
jgi:precorrin-6A/cobalt-precorrin-6A reductase